jgi:hypothetical protein
MLLDESFALVVNSTAPRLLARSSVSGAAWLCADGMAANVAGCVNWIRGEVGGGAPPATHERRWSHALSATRQLGNGLA